MIAVLYGWSAGVLTISFFYFSYYPMTCKVLGMGISSALSYEMRRWRVWERVRLSLLSLMLDSDTSGYRLLDRYRKPSSVDDLDGTPLQPNTDKAENKTDIPCGVLHEIVSPDWTLTSKMAVDALTLFPGSEIVPVPALGVEFYYVVRGKGKYLKDNEEPADIGAGECFVVDPKWYVFNLNARGATLCC